MTLTPGTSTRVPVQPVVPSAELEAEDAASNHTTSATLTLSEEVPAMSRIGVLTAMLTDVGWEVIAMAGTIVSPGPGTKLTMMESVATFPEASVAVTVIALAPTAKAITVTATDASGNVAPI